MRYHFYLSSILLLLSFSIKAQQYCWIRADSTIQFPNGIIQELPVFALPNGGLIQTKIQNQFFNYNQNTYSVVEIQQVSTNGELIWNYTLGDSVCVRDIVVDDSGRVYLGGLFMSSLSSDGHEPTQNTSQNIFGTNMFLIRLSSTGEFEWIRNVSLGLSGFNNELLDDLSIDHLNRCWYSYSTFDKIQVRRLSESGTDVQLNILNGGLITGDMDFDNTGNLFLTGAIGSGSMTVNSSSFNAPYSYNYFVTKISPTGTCNWINFYEDITFQTPSLRVDADGDPVFVAHLFDSTSFGNFTLTPSSFGGDFALVKLNTNGDVLWARDIPDQSDFGDFMLLNRHSLDIDETGKTWIGGTFRGNLTFENSIQLSSGDITNYNLSFLQFLPDGTINRAIEGGGNGYDFTCGLSVSASGDLYFSGIFQDTAQFGTIEIIGSEQFSPIIGKWSADPFAGIEDIDLYWKVGPNPSNGVLSIQGNEIDFLYVLDTQGRILHTSKKKQNLDFSYLPAGIYFLKLVNGNTSRTIPWIKTNF